MVKGVSWGRSEIVSSLERRGVSATEGLNGDISKGGMDGESTVEDAELGG